eukprot:Nk52_evm1s268 gene=Nk52_evmTU1s268
MIEDDTLKPHPPAGSKKKAAGGGRKPGKLSKSKSGNGNAVNNWLGSLPGNPRTAWMGANSKTLPLNNGGTVKSRRPSSSMGSTSKRSKSSASQQHAPRPSSAVDQRGRRSSSSLSDTFPIEKEKKKTYIELKDPVEMRDEMLELKKMINALKEERKILKHNYQRLEVESKKKEKKLEDILAGKPSVGPGRDSLRESSLVSILKLKVKECEKQVQEKDSEMQKMKAQCNYTRMVELEVELETYQNEIQRLCSILEGEDGKGGSNNYMAEKNKALFKENKELRDDLAHTLDELYELKQNAQVMSSNFSVNTTDSQKISSLESELESLKAKYQSLEKEKSDMEETFCQKIEKLAKTNDELEEKLSLHQEIVLSKTNEEADGDSNANDIDKANDNDNDVVGEEVMNREESFASTAVGVAEVEEEKGRGGSKKKDKKKKKKKKKKKGNSEKDQEDEVAADSDVDDEDKRRRASLTIQNSWRQKQAKGELEARKRQKQEKDEATMTIQAALRGYEARKRGVQKQEMEESIVSIQASLKGHMVRREKGGVDEKKANVGGGDTLSIKSSKSMDSSERGNSTWANVDNTSLFEGDEKPSKGLEEEEFMGAAQSINSMEFDTISAASKGESIISGEFAPAAPKKKVFDDLESIGSVSEASKEEQENDNLSLSASTVESDLDFGDDDDNDDELSFAGLDEF